MPLRRDRLMPILVVMLFLLAACGAEEVGDDDEVGQEPTDGENGEDVAEDGELTTLSFWYQETVFGAPIFVALENGWLEESLADIGYELSLDSAVAGPPIVEAVAAGQADIGEIGVAPAVTGVGRGIPMQIIATTNLAGESVMVPADSDAEDLSDLVGGTIAIHGRATMQDFVVRRGLIDAGVDPDADVDFIEMDPQDQRVALARGEIDAGVLWEPHTAILQVNEEARVLAFGQELWPDHDNQAICASEEVMEQHPEAVAVVIEQIARALEWMEENVEESQEITARWLGIEDMDVMRQSWENITRPDTPEPNPDSLEEFAEALHEWGIIPEPLSADDMVELRFLP